MAMNQKKSRTIIVNGIPFRFAVRSSTRNQDGSFNLNITAQHESGDGSYLKVNGVYTRDFWLDTPDQTYESTEYFKVTPKHVAELISIALEKGWQPKTKAPPFQLKANNSHLRAL